MMGGYKKVVFEVTQKIPVEWSDKEKKNPIRFNTKLDEYGFNVYNFSYWKGETLMVESENKKDVISRTTMLYLTGNKKAIKIPLSREEFERQLELQVGNDIEAKTHLVEAKNEGH